MTREMKSFEGWDWEMESFEGGQCPGENDPHSFEGGINKISPVVITSYSTAYLLCIRSHCNFQGAFRRDTSFLVNLNIKEQILLLPRYLTG